MGVFRLFPEQASTLAPEVDHLLYFLLAVTVFFTLLIFGAIFYFAIRYRRRSENELPRVLHTGYTLEIVWSVLPFGLTMVMFTWERASSSAARALPITPCRSTRSASNGCGSSNTWKACARSTSCMCPSTGRSASPWRART